MTAELTQSTDCVLMIRPACFYSNPETAKTNEFQHAVAQEADALENARREFDGAVDTLRNRGVSVIVVDDNDDPQTPDAIFPNNWLTTHAEGTTVLYPMQPISRRGERRLDVIDLLRLEHGRQVRHVIDWSGYEAQAHYLEGTGSLVLDRVHGVAYACLSARTDTTVLDHFCRQFGYESVVFSAMMASGQSIYHTNVMMCIGTGYAVVCLESIPNQTEREQVRERLAKHHVVVEISLDQVAQFAGNMLEVQSSSGERLLILSERAQAVLNLEQNQVLAAHAELVACDVKSIEFASGGSIRCMLAEIFLP